ncbi:ribosome small subunit-dependent GTPase A [Rhodocytophaga aerolata]|uniref:Small ribosomal subunit biogenesis GTPase RsgA n=1 Tax=Rhodocytophaga aerolata TaxID=455078 RepID=A0ABT8R7C5_9BACT|nr:ribosome small subunit-dependent GTPase A [Rhodocytophaga aerolata]MDO1448008.1 ribosome small subunit-dependent GTPase A [Rhodocytophaga aerolata]
MNHPLEGMGFTPYFNNQFISYKNQGFSAGRIVQENKTRYVVYSEYGLLTGELTGKLLYTSQSPADLPKVGDWVVISVFEQEQKAIIHEVLKRKTCFSRKVPGAKVEEQIIATNIDLLFIVQSLDQSYNIRRLERYLVMAHESGARPVVVLNKSDLCHNLEEKLTEVKASAGNVPVVALSCLEDNVSIKLAPYLQPGITIAFTGSSGVGKSSLINQLAGEKRLETGLVRSVDSKGRHTTTHRELLLLENGVILIDTPGMRELQLWQAEEGLDEAFEDISQLTLQCRFADCSHTQEKGCAVLAAIDAGELLPERYQSFLKLQKELNYLSVKTDIHSFLAHKKQVKSLHKQLKNSYKHRE